MINIINKEKCSGCHACATACPENCISMEKDEEGFLYPKVKEERCINCGICEKVCPIIVRNPFYADVTAYAMKNQNEEIRMQSSSGGVFTAISEMVIANGGVVFGAAFDESFNVKHICVDNVEELSKLRGSKYLQSTIGDTYKQAKNLLANGRTVYFTGTPCQIEGLLKYLDKDYDNLITSDIICHGVPSPLVWQQYLKSISSSSVTEVSFRNKSLGWENFSVLISFEDETEHKSLSRDNKYMKAFLSNLCLRPSCYNCAFKTKNRVSDLTLADFWGINNVAPEMNDNKGTSLVLVHTQNGKEKIKKISNELSLKEVDVDLALLYNSSAVKSVEKPKNRDIFMQKIKSENFDKIVEKYSKRTFFQRVKSKIKRILKKVLN